MFACRYCVSLGLISSFIITIKKDKEKYFGEENCIGGRAGALSDGRSYPYRRHFLQIEHETETVVHVSHFVRRNCADPLRQE